MRKLVTRTTIDKPRADVWSQLRDLRVARNYVPGVTDIEITTPHKEGIGASRKVHMKKRGTVDETVIAWDDGYGFTLKIHNGDQPAKPFREAIFQYVIEDGPDGGTAVTLLFTYNVGMGRLGRLFDTVILKSGVARSNRIVAANMKKFYETAEQTNTDAV